MDVHTLSIADMYIVNRMDIRRSCLTGKKDASIMNEPATLEEAFGVDGEAALKVVRLISSDRRAEIGH